MKYTDTLIGFQEFPDEITLCINISNCPYHCKGCHSPHLWEDVGTELNTLELDRLIKANEGITCVGFMGGEPRIVNAMAAIVKYCYGLKSGWYTGLSSLPENVDKHNFDYVKFGRYIEELGGLDNPRTNQRMFKIEGDNLLDITHRFWKNDGIRN